MRVVRYQLGKFAPEPGEDIPIFKEPAPSDAPSSTPAKLNTRDSSGSDRVIAFALLLSAGALVLFL